MCLGQLVINSVDEDRLVWKHTTTWGSLHFTLHLSVYDVIPFLVTGMNVSFT